MTQNTKVIVPQEIAERLKEFNGDRVLFDIESMSRSPFGGIQRLYQFYCEKPKDYFAALVNGFDVELSPEEKLREYYDYSFKKESDAEAVNDLQKSYYYCGVSDAVIKTLSILGITIEGING